MGSRLQHATHSDTHRLTSPGPKIILVTYKIDVHPFSPDARLRDRPDDPRHRPSLLVRRTHTHELLGNRVLGGGGGTITRLPRQRSRLTLAPGVAGCHS